MAIYGRALRQAARDRAAETPERIADREIVHQAWLRATTEAQVAFPDGEGTLADFREYQELRAQVHLPERLRSPGFTFKLQAAAALGAFFLSLAES